MDQMLVDNPPQYRRVFERPGRLAPRWLQDLLSGSLGDEPGAAGPLFANCESLPGRLSLPPTTWQDEPAHAGIAPPRCHELLMSESQTFAEDAREVVSCLCKHCKYHFILDITRDPHLACGSRSDPSSLLCHFVLLSSRDLSAQEADKWYPVVHTAQWQCSGPQCTARVKVSMSRPRMKSEHVRWIVDEDRIHNQRREALAQDPERFANLNESLEKKPLLTLNAYLRDCLGQSASPEPKKVASRNKVFVVQFGPQSLPIFEYLGFEVRDIDGEEYLVLPRPPAAPPALGHTEIGSLRAFYEDARNETLALVDEGGREQLMMPQYPARARLERALGCYGHPNTSRPKPQDDLADLEALGAPVDANEPLLRFAFRCQTQTNPARVADYTRALQSLASSRSHDLQIHAATEASLVDDAVARRAPEDPLEQAYLRFGFAPFDDPPADWALQARFKAACGQDPSQITVLRQSLLRIGKARNNQALVDAACDITDFKEACRFLDVEDLGHQASADVLIGFAEAQIRDGKEPVLIAAAMSRIGDEIGSDELKEKATIYRQFAQYDEPIPPANAGSSASQSPSNMSLPAGLDNLRNTCYLNSILQYFFTVKAVRNVVLNFDPAQVPSADDALSNGELYLGREFVTELKKLFSELETTPAAFVKPQQRLANAAWISADKILKDKEDATSSPHSAAAPANEKCGPAPPPLPARPVPPVPSQQDAVTTTTTADPVSESSDSASISSSQTLMGPADAGPDFSGETSAAHASSDDKDKSEDDQSEDKSKGAAPPPASDADTTIPDADSSEDVHKGAKPSPDALNDAIGGALSQTEIKGTEQMDVEEVMGRCINHLRSAINPASVTNVNGTGDSRDEIMENLYITFSTARKEKDAPSYNRITSQERWVTANPAASGSTDLYEALDGYFEREFIANKLLSFTSIVTAPPIFHICIQRSQVGGGKNTNPVAIPDVLYLDRYMEAAEDSAVLRARKRGWDIKNQLKDVEQPPDFGYDEAVGGGGGAAATASAAALDAFVKIRSDGHPEPGGGDEDYDVIDPSIKSILDRHGKPLPGVDTSDISPELGDDQVGATEDEHMWEGDVRPADALDAVVEEHKSRLREELDGLFSTMQTHKYCLHAVICHAGQTAKSGHYWVWIYDFDRAVWRKYNDRTVTETADARAVLQELSTRGEPYYLMYVRDRDKHDLVDVPRRREALAEADATGGDTEMTDSYSQPTTDHLEYSGSGIA